MSDAPLAQSKQAEPITEQASPTLVPQVTAQAGSATLTQLTQIPAYVPPHVWTTAALLDLHEKQKDIQMANIRSADDQRKMANRLNWGAFILIAVIIVCGLWLVFLNNPFGKDIIGATILFLSGFLAGQGAQKRF